MQVYTKDKQLSDTEKAICNNLQKNYNDINVRQTVLTWWNRNNPTNTVEENSNIYGIDLIGVENPNFGIEVEHSFTWNIHKRPQSFKTVRIPIRKSRYWIPRESEAIFVQMNKVATACVVLTDDVIRNKFYSKIIMTKVGYKEHFLEYYVWNWYDMTNK